MGLARGLTTSIVSLVYVVVLNFWLLKDMHKLQRSFFETIPSAYQEEIRRLTSNLSDIWEAFLRGQLVLSLVIGSITWICLVILGMPNATGLALLAGLMEFLPSIGPAISGTIGTVLAFFQGSTWLPVGNFFFAVIVGIVYAIIGQVESVYFIPRFVGGRVKLHPAVTFAGIIAGALTFGVLGILLAAPTIASTRELLYYITCKLTDRVPYEAGPSEPVLHIPGVIAGRKIEAVVFELDGTLTPVDMAAVDWIADRSDWMDRAMQPETRRLTVRRYLARLEAPINMFLNQLWRMRWFDTIERVQPNCDILRGMPPADQMALQPDIRNTMFHLANRYRLALVSTRDRAAVDQFIEREHLDSNLFGLVLAREDVRNTLPHVEPLMRVANAFGLEAGQLLVVSDTDVGLRAGRAAGMATSGVLGGIPLPDDLREADIVVQDVSHLGEYL
jgi:beta-phosphoglucomutase-like phosphatase (HAD superfamily)